MFILQSLILVITSFTQTQNLSLQKSLNLCSQVLNIQQIQSSSTQNEICYFCKNDIDRDEPIKIYNVTTNTTFQILKNKSQIVSVFWYQQQGGVLFIGTTNSTVYMYDLHNKKINFIFRNPQPNVLVEGIAPNLERKIVSWVGVDGKICVGDWLKNTTNCILAHSFNATAISALDSGLLITCGGDRLCKSWRIQQPETKLVLVKTYPLTKVNKVTTIICSDRRALVGGPDSSEFINLDGKQIANPFGLPNFGTVCGMLIEKWNTLLAVTPDGFLITIDLITMNANKQSFGDRIVSCQFIEMNRIITGHQKGISRIWAN